MINNSNNPNLPLGDQRKIYVKTMFNGIAHRYDFLNHILSFGVDFYWRKRTISVLDNPPHSLILDLATGTGDLAIQAISQKSFRVVGVDIASEMLRHGQSKISNRGCENKPNFINGDGEQLPFKNDVFDGAMIAFGIRNMGNMQSAIQEVGRVLKPGCPFAILEFSLPENPVIRNLYALYFNHILPRIGKFISGDKRAYSYLPESVGDFPDIEQFVRLFSENGFQQIEYWKLMNGIAVIYRGKKQLQV